MVPKLEMLNFHHVMGFPQIASHIVTVTLHKIIVVINTQKMKNELEEMHCGKMEE